MSLRIERYLLPDYKREVTTRDYILETRPKLKARSHYAKGSIKEYTNYLGEEDELVVRNLFTDIIEEGKFLGVKVVHQWIKEGTEDEVGKELEEEVIMDVGVAFDYLRKRRQRLISYLQITAKGTPIEAGVETLLKYYFTEVELFIQGGTKDLEDAINNEETQAIKDLLNTVVSAEGTTVKDTILNQITV